MHAEGRMTADRSACDRAQSSFDGRYRWKISVSRAAYGCAGQTADLCCEGNRYLSGGPREQS